MSCIDVLQLAGVHVDEREIVASLTARWLCCTHGAERRRCPDAFGPCERRCTEHQGRRSSVDAGVCGVKLSFTHIGEFLDPPSNIYIFTSGARLLISY